MFVRLTRPARAKAGWFVALLYLFCVLAPGVALALGDAASCLMHQPGTAAAAHFHDGAQPEHVAAHQHHEMQTDQHATDHADTGDVMPVPAKHQHDGKGSAGPCCAMLCVSAIAADPPAVAKPSQPMSICASKNVQRLPGEAPPRHFRPPIA
ncbi:hypothetical protein [Bradyrhizobium sp. RDI18]|uniref:hypothetical protein n=1 Tax=Bradyrhizobium sp. RDI18 TaxID=3367400 RepID=UPI003722CC40